MGPLHATELLDRMVRYFLKLGVIEGFISLLVLFLIPTDPKNAWLLGYSVTRLLMAGTILGIIGLQGWFLFWIVEKRPRFMRLKRWLAGRIKTYGFSISIFLFFLTIIYLGTYIYLYFTTPNLTTLQGYLVRFSPFMLLAGTRSIQAMIIFAITGHRLRKEASLESEPQMNTIGVHPIRVAVNLGMIALLLIFASIFILVISRITWDPRLLGIGPRFDLNREHNIPSFFSAILLLVSGTFFGIIALVKNQQTDPFKVHWAFLSFIYFFLAIDEATTIHEMFSDPLRALLKTGGIFYYAWLIVALPLILVFIISYWRFLTHLPQKNRNQILSAWAVFIIGAILFEMLGGWYEGRFGDTSLIYTLINTIEESLEMAGAILLIHAILAYISTHIKTIRLVFSNPETGNNP